LEGEAIFVGIRLGTTSATPIRVGIVIRIAIVIGVMPVADGLVVAVLAEGDRRTHAPAATPAVALVALLSQRHATMGITDRGVV
jgi:hypothetical protein